MLIVQVAEQSARPHIRRIRWVLVGVIHSMLDCDQALSLLKQLDQRQEQILTDIDVLNDRIEALLKSFQASRAATTEPPMQQSLGATAKDRKIEPLRKKAA